ncbi:MAG: hypothetical protein M5R36_17940 [Deltaproteobacteria bacterium]|nr:hypothetical protein [Deltaproteobacteria bacterium]
MPRTVFALAVAAAMFVAGFSAVSSAEYLTGLSHGMDKRRAEDPPPVADTLALRCARNEWEPFQVFVFDDAGLTGVDVNVSAFTGPGDSMETVELYRAAYVPVTAETISHSPPDVTKIGTWPDGLIPFVDHFVGEVRDGAPFDVAPGFAQAVWAEVFVPEDQAPGTYEATVTVTADGRAPWTGTVTLAVWDFVIPTGISIKSNYGYSHATVWNFHQAHGGITARRDLLSMYFREFLRHRMSLYSYLDFMPGYSWNGAADAFDWDWTEFDAYFGPLWDGTFDEPGARFTGMTLPWPPGGRPGDVDAGVWERAWWGGWADHFRAKGWLDVPFLYLPDEPNPSEYAYVAELADRLHAADPDLKAMVTEQFNEELAGHVDIWDPDEPLFSDSLPWPPYPDVYAERRAMGEEDVVV